MAIYEILGTAASSIAILTFLIVTLTYYGKSWLRTQFEGNVSQLLPKLVNDDTSVARYAHQARDAAGRAVDAALDARDAVNEVKEVSYEIRDLVKDLRSSTETYHVTHTSTDEAIATRDFEIK